jgi:tellurite resistance protein TerC
VSLREALAWSIIWTVLALAFNAWIYYWISKPAGLAFFTGYLIERSLSIDNIFVFYLVFSYFGVPKEYQHKVLFWGILGALAMRALFIAVGVSLINRFHWVIYIFGAFLIFTGIKMAISKETEIHPERNPVPSTMVRYSLAISWSDTCLESRAAALEVRARQRRPPTGLSIRCTRPR